MLLKIDDLSVPTATTRARLIPRPWTCRLRLSAGIALVIAALAAKGVSTISNANVIDRGYVAVEESLKSLGASIERR